MCESSPPGHNPRTANARKSIWRPLQEKTFREQLILLSKGCGQVPSGPVSDRIYKDTSEDKLLILEATITRGVAFIAAAHEGVETVSAAYVDGIKSKKGSEIYLASNAGISTSVRQHLDRILCLLNDLAAKDICMTNARSKILSEIITLNKARIHARLRSHMWQPTFHIRYSGANESPLWHNLTDIYDGRNVSRQPEAAKAFKKRLHCVIGTMKSLDRLLSPENEVSSLSQLTEACHMLCSSDGIMSFAETLSAAGLLYLLQNKHVRQLEKIAAYFDTTILLTSAWQRYASRLASSKIIYLTPYKPVLSNISVKGAPVSCHVHAEIQLLVHFDKSRTSDGHPRVLGTSKAACFLCARFISLHGSFIFENAHSRIYDQWTIPDLAEYTDEQVLKYRRVIRSMYQQIQLMSQGSLQKRPFPLTSWLDLHGKPPFSGPSSKKTTPALSLIDVGPEVVLVNDDSARVIDEVVPKPDLQQEKQSLVAGLASFEVADKTEAQAFLNIDGSMHESRVHDERQHDEVYHDPDFQTREATARNGGDHESRSCQVLPEDTVVRIPTSGSISRVVNLCGLELYFELDLSSPRQAVVLPVSKTDALHSRMVDISKLTPGDEISIELRPEESRARFIFLKMRRSKMEDLCLKIEWQDDL